MLVCSLTRAAAAEISSRGLPLPPENVGTLHAIGYRAIGRPPVVGRKHLADWNAEHPQWLMASGIQRSEDGEQISELVPTDAAGAGDGLLARASLYHAQLRDRSTWPDILREFDDAWQEFLTDNGLVDFTGMLRRPLDETMFAPNRPRVIIVDEAQDCSALDLKLVRYWARSCEFLLLAGDGDQSIFAFRGGSIDAFLGGNVAPEHNYSLTQSYRVPRAVHAAATRWISSVKKRYAVDYKPRDADGRYCVDTSLRGGRHSESILAAVQRALEDQENVMVLAPCSHTLMPILRVFRDNGVLFHNPYRTTNGAWNPLRGGVERMRSLVLPITKLGGHPRPRLWTWAELWHWAEPLRSKGILQDGAKKRMRIESESQESHDQIPDIARLRREIFTEQATSDLAAAAQSGAQALVEWHRRSVLASWSKRFEYAYAVATSDPRRLLQSPRVVVGTVHSVKGGQASSVFLIPELSIEARRTWTEDMPGTKDEIRRMIYVGMTRAREQLTICGGRKGMCVRLPGT